MARLDRNSKKDFKNKKYVEVLLWVNTLLILGLYYLSYLGK